MAHKPNILMILSDQHRYDCIGFSDRYPVITPCLDRLAGEGVWFDNAYTPIPTCCPARQSLITGRRPEQFGAYWNYDVTLPIGALEPDAYSFVRDLSNAGYITGFMGKWHVNGQYGPDAYGYTDVVPVDHEYGKKFSVHRPSNDPCWRGWVDDRPIEETHMSYVASRAKDKLREYADQDRPWLLSVHFEEPHPAVSPQKDFAALYKAEDVPMWAGFCDEFENKPYIQKQQLLSWNMHKDTWADWAPTVAMYYAYITQMDAAIGQVMDQLRQLRLDEDTIVIYTSDHGDMCGSHRMFDKHYILYEDVIHIPLIIRYGSRFKPMRTSAYSMNCLDMAPTLLELAGIPTTARELQGRSLVPVLEGKIPTDWPKEAVATYNGQQFGLYNQRCIKTDRYKYIWNLTDIDELYDLTEDPAELYNLIDSPVLADELSRLRLRLRDLLIKMKDPLCSHPLGWVVDSQLRDGRKLGRSDKLPLNQ